MNEIIYVGQNQQLAQRQADNDEQLLRLWLHGRADGTIRIYRADARRFLQAVGKPLIGVTLADLQGYADALSGAPASRARILAAIKSLFTFAHELGYLPFDTAKVLKLPKVKNTLAERILSEKATIRMIGEKHDDEAPMEKRNRMILTMLYVGGLRVSELCSLKWRDCQDRDEGQGQVTVFGKGSKTRVIKLPASVWGDLIELRAGDDDPVFRSREGGHLDQSQANRIVKAAARRARVSKAVSPHWMRHAHASHAIDRGAPIHLVQATLGHASVATTGRYLHARPSDSSSRYLAI